jgi:hypothetical protein
MGVGTPRSDRVRRRWLAGPAFMIQGPDGCRPRARQHAGDLVMIARFRSVEAAASGTPS